MLLLTLRLSTGITSNYNFTHILESKTCVAYFMLKSSCDSLLQAYFMLKSSCDSLLQAYFMLKSSCDSLLQAYFMLKSSCDSLLHYFQNPSWQSFDVSQFQDEIDIQAKCILSLPLIYSYGLYL